MILVYAGYNVGALSLDMPSDGGIPGRSTPVATRIPPVFTVADGRTWGLEAPLVSFDAVVGVAKYGGRLAMGTQAAQAATAIAGLSAAERRLADNLLACRSEHITALARALYRAGRLEHARIIELISPLGSLKPPRR